MVESIRGVIEEWNGKTNQKKEGMESGWWVVVDAAGIHGGARCGRKNWVAGRFGFTCRSQKEQKQNK